MADENSNKLYFAGDLFDHKHLIGNQILAEFIQLKSGGDIHVLLPQTMEQTVERAVDVRNQDYALILESDLALFNFDGTDLDSGTVAEFMFAKMLDLPAAILRTDFRNAGDGLKDGDPWNLMLTGFPRTEKLIVHSMAEYQSHRKEEVMRFVDSLYGKMAETVIFGLATAKVNKRITDLDTLISLYQAAILTVGEDFRNFLKLRWNLDDSNFDTFLRELIEKKKAKGIY